MELSMDDNTRASLSNIFVQPCEASSAEPLYPTFEIGDKQCGVRRFPLVDIRHAADDWETNLSRANI